MTRKEAATFLNNLAAHEESEAWVVIGACQLLRHIEGATFDDDCTDRDNWQRE